MKSDPKGPPKDPVLSPELSKQPVSAAHGDPPSTSAPEVPPVIIIQESSATKSANPEETQDSQGGNALEPGEIQPEPAHPLVRSSSTCGDSREAEADPSAMDSDPGGDNDDGSSESGSSYATPIKKARGRKSNKKQREERSYADILQGSQLTLKAMVNTRSKHG